MSWNTKSKTKNMSKVAKKQTGKEYRKVRYLTTKILTEWNSYIKEFGGEEN